MRTLRAVVVVVVGANVETKQTSRWREGAKGR